ncbi:MAG: ABC transporter substrate-binding protein [Rhodospirillales bacterium]|nr:ABC transporter substrate-binding protein [Rhodospirillales bacterium]
MANGAPSRLRIALGRYRHTEALRDGTLSAPGITLDVVAVEPIHRAFAPMAREQAYDAAEIAVATQVLAHGFGKPLVLLPIVLASRFQHRCLIRLASRPELTPQALAGKRIAVRAYSQTTGMWVRGILRNEYGVAADSVRWITFEGAHLAEYADPPWVERAPPGAAILAMLRAGAVDAAILGNDLPDAPDLAPVIADPDAAAEDWYRRHGTVPINHMLAVTEALAATRPEAARALFGLLRQSREQAGLSAAAQAMLPVGIAAIRPSLSVVLDYCAQQRLLARPISVDEMFAPARALLGDDAG